VDTLQPVEADPTLCPRCGGKLANPGGLGWCSQCGYCRSLEEEPAAAVLPAPEAEATKKPSALGAAEFAETVKLLPRWSWPLIGGTLAIVFVCLLGNGLLPEACLARAIWGTAQLLLSFVVLVGAQLWIILLVGASQDGLGPKDLFLPGRVWRTALRRLPETRGPVWLGAWSLTAIGCSLALIGGLTYWFEVLREAKEAERLRALAARADAGDRPLARDKEGAADTEREAARAEAARGAAEKALASGERALAQCAVIGYQTDSSGNVTGLVLATSGADKLHFAGVVETGLTPQMSKELAAKLAQLRRSEPLIPGLQVKGTFWVRPGLFCDVTHVGASKKGELQEAVLKEVRD
jgi:hypothetical protein